jgi:hypothetical protein
MFSLTQPHLCERTIITIKKRLTWGGGGGVTSILDGRFQGDANLAGKLRAKQILKIK